jgi:hypothetical protein
MTFHTCVVGVVFIHLCAALQTADMTAGSDKLHPATPGSILSPLTNQFASERKMHMLIETRPLGVGQAGSSADKHVIET